MSRAEATYANQLSKLAQHVGQIVNGFTPGDPSTVPTLSDMLRRYADALMPWAEATAKRMIEDVNARDVASWRRLGAEFSAQLRNDILNAPTGETMRELLAGQVELIRSIPLDAAQRVHELTLAGLEDSTRASEIAKEIMRSGDVAKSRAMLIARTEVARTASSLTQVRAKHVGSEGYIWRTSRDGDVRSSHRAMNGKFIPWDSPPTLDGMTGHAGCLPNCRCWSEPVIPED